MILSDILEQLQYGELRHLKLGELESENERKVVISAINLGLIELHKRFYLMAKQVILDTQENVYEYKLNEVLNASNNFNQDPFNYIDNGFDQIYNNDLIKIERIFNQDNEELPLNDKNKESSFFTPQYNILRVPLDYPPNSAIIEYRALPEKLSYKEDCENIEVELPIALLEPLLLFVRYRVGRILNFDSEPNQATSNYLQLYEDACTKISNLGYQIVLHSTNSKLDDRGWV